MQILRLWKGWKAMDENMNNLELLKISLEEFSRIQSYMLAVDKNSDVYKSMKTRYIELKIFLNVSGVNLTELDIIKE